MNTTTNVTIGTRMSLTNVVSGKINDAPKTVLGYGPEGVGKSTWAAGAPSPIWLPLDNRTSHLDVNRLPRPESWDDALDGLRILATEKHDYKTIVVDPINWLEPICHERVTGKGGSILAYDGGFGRGENAAMTHWRDFLWGLERLRERGMNVILLAHAVTKSFKDPEGPEYDRYEVAMGKGPSGLFRQWSDYVIFMRQKAVGKADKKGARVRGQSLGERVACPNWSAAYDAKFSGPPPSGDLPLSWQAFADAVAAAREKIEDLKKGIEAAVAELGDEKVAAKVKKWVAEARDNDGKLTEILRAVEVRIAKKNEAAGMPPAAEEKKEEKEVQAS